MANVTVRVACDEMLIVEDHQMKEQKNNSREVQVSSQQEMEVYTVQPQRRREGVYLAGEWGQAKGRRTVPASGGTI